VKVKEEKDDATHVSLEQMHEMVEGEGSKTVLRLSGVMSTQEIINAFEQSLKNESSYV